VKLGWNSNGTLPGPRKIGARFCRIKGEYRLTTTNKIELHNMAYSRRQTARKQEWEVYQLLYLNLGQIRLADAVGGQLHITEVLKLRHKFFTQSLWVNGDWLEVLHAKQCQELIRQYACIRQ